MVSATRTLVGLATASACALVAAGEPITPVAQAHLQPAAAIGALPRIGVNLGHRTAWGAEQLIANVLRNPGLEPGHDGALVVLGPTRGRTLVDDNVWTARGENFWTGAQFEVLSGAAAGRSGRVADDHAGHGEGRTPTEFEFDPLPPGLQEGDVIAVQGEQDTGAVAMWWTEGIVRAQPGQARPGSPGKQSVRLTGSSIRTAALIHHLDGITARAGKLLPVNGRWRVSLWARAATPGARLGLSLARQGATPWLKREWTPGTAWEEITLEFEARDVGPAGPLQFSVTARNGSIDVDDIALVEPDAGPGGFRKAVVETLRRMKPGYLRDWQGQLADTPANRTAPAFARQPVRYRPGAAEWQFAYSADEFAALAAAVQARPWFVLPSTTTVAQARAFGETLRRLWQRYRFDEMVIEHGNEHWNSVFRPAGIQAPATLSAVAERTFRAVREGAGADVPLHRVLGAQFVRPETLKALGAAGRQVEGIAVAPYFLYRLESGDSVATGTQRALDEPADAFARARTALPAALALDVYEVNLHTTLGDADEHTRNAVITSAAAGTALARRFMQGVLGGVQRQAAYALSGFDTPIEGAQRSLVRLFGLTRDLGEAGRLRPTGEALARLNALDWSDVRRTRCEGSACPRLTALSLGAGQQWSVVSSSPETVRLTWSCSLPQRVGWLDGSVRHEVDDPAAARWSERSVGCVAGRAEFDLPAHSFMTAVSRQP